MLAGFLMSQPFISSPSSLMAPTAMPPSHSPTDMLTLPTRPATVEDDAGLARRGYRSSFSADQLMALEKAFASTPYPNTTEREALARKTQLPEARIQVRDLLS